MISNVRVRQFRPISQSCRNIQTVAVVGLGLMGHGIAQVTAQAGYNVLAIEAQKEALDIGVKRIEGSLAKVIAKDTKTGKYKSEAEGKQAYDEIISRVKTTTNIADAKDCDLVVEAIVENMGIKLNFYKNLGTLIKPSAIFASNTSSLQITQMGLASGRPDKFVGLHFFNPVQIMKLVEVIRTEHTSQESFESIMSYGKKIGKTTVSCGDTPGFIVNRLLIPYLSQALCMVDRNDASVRDIDVSMQLGAGHPMGPITLADYVGLDTCLNILKGWKEDYPNEPSFVIPKCLESKVKAGHLGRKSGKGFYNWNGDKVGDPVA